MVVALTSCTRTARVNPRSSLGTLAARGGKNKPTPTPSPSITPSPSPNPNPTPSPSTIPSPTPTPSPVGASATNTVIVSSANPSLSGREITFTAAVVSAYYSNLLPSGNVTFSLEGTSKSVPLKDGIAEWSLSTLSAGPHNITASYSGDSHFAASVSASYKQMSADPSASFAKPWVPSKSVNVRTAGLVDDGITDNAVALQSLIDTATPGTLFYFPKATAGIYLVGRTISFDKMPSFAMRGDVDAGGLPVSVIQGTQTSGNVISVNWRSGGQTFTIKNMKFISQGMATGFYNFESNSSSFENCTFVSDYVGLNWIPFAGAIRNSRFQGTGKPGSIGLVIWGATADLIENSEFSGWDEGMRLAGVGVSVAKSRFFANKTGARLGASYKPDTDADGMTIPDGSNWGFTRSAFNDCVFEDNDTGLYIQVGAHNTFSNITIKGSTNSPSKQSKIGLHLYAVSKTVFNELSVTGSYSTGSVYAPGVDLATFFSANVSNSYLDSNDVWIWDTRQGGWDKPVACQPNSKCSYNGIAWFQNAKIGCAAGTMTVKSSTFGSNNNRASCINYAAPKCNGTSVCSLFFSPNADSCGVNPDPAVGEYGNITIECNGGTVNPLPVDFRQVAFNSGFVSNYVRDADNILASNRVSSVEPTVSDSSLVLDVTQFGVKGDNLTDNTTALRNLVASAQNGAVFYFPRGMYRFSGTIDFSRLKSFAIYGDMSSSGSHAGSELLAGIEGPLIKVDYGAGAGTFKMRDIGIVNIRTTLGGGISVYTRNAVLSSLENVRMTGNIGMKNENSFRMALRTVHFNGWGMQNLSGVGLLMEGDKKSTVENGNFTGWTEGVRATGSGIAIFGTRFEVNDIGMHLGYEDANGNLTPLEDASIQGIQFESDTTDLKMANCKGCFVAGVGTQGHDLPTPAGWTQYGLYVGASSNSTIAASGFGGANAIASIYVEGRAQGINFVNTAAWNGYGGSSTIWKIEKEESVTLNACQ